MSRVDAPIIWSAGTVLPLWLAEAMLRPAAAPSVAWGVKSASLAGVLQELPPCAGFRHEPKKTFLVGC